MKYVALLRGINVGGNKKVEMKKLKEVFEKIGFKDVRTYINSGNVLFESTLSLSGLNKKIERELKACFGFEISTLVLEKKSFDLIEKKIPKDWKNDSVQRTDVLFLWEDYDKKESVLLAKGREGVDNLLYIKGVIVWNVLRVNINKSGMKNFIGSSLYKNMTARNVNTVRRLMGM